MGPLLAKCTYPPNFADFTDFLKGIPERMIQKRWTPGCLELQCSFFLETKDPRTARLASAASCGRKPGRHLPGSRVSLPVVCSVAWSTACPGPHNPGASGCWNRTHRFAGRGPSARSPVTAWVTADCSDSRAAFPHQRTFRGLVSLCASSSLNIICFLTVKEGFGDEAAFPRASPGDGAGSWLSLPRSCPGHRKSRGYLSEVKGTINTIKNERVQVQRKSGYGQGRTEEKEESGSRGSLSVSLWTFSIPHGPPGKSQNPLAFQGLPDWFSELVNLWL